MTLFDKFNVMKNATAGNYWASRIVNQIGYALRLSEADGNRYDEKIAQAADFVFADFEKNGAITASAAKEAEKMLAFMSTAAKATKIICVSHAHIDMNWQWGYQETVAATIDTFRTILDLMNEYPEFIYSQSQASVYKIVEEHDPDMLHEIKKRVQEGRWEITASTWVETDKNMPNGESLARHILYTKQYLSKLFDIKADSMQLDFEPDTFGHNLNVPEILNKGGVKYYYHCRGYDGEYLYKWQSPSGGAVLVYREPEWYNAEIDPDMFYCLPQYCEGCGVDIMLKVYGVGNHGGGPTRRDIEIISDMMTWPVMPEMKFGTYHEYFGLLEKYADNLPVVNQELNFIFTGCYTSQSRIKMANRISEDRLYAAEAIGTAASVLSGSSYAKSFSQAWENVLFNHFHDILPGSGVIDTREHAMGLFQEALAKINTNTTNALRLISENIDTSSIDIEIDKASVSEGGGVGFATEQGSGYKFPQTERGNGKVRIFHIFNPTEFDREGPAEITVWDWNYNRELISVTDAGGNSVEWKLMGEPEENGGYWGHTFFKLAISARVPAFGYATYVLTEEAINDVPKMKYGRPHDPRVEYFSDDIIMENDKVKAVFDKETMQLISFIHKGSGEEVISKENPSAIFRYITEYSPNGMSAWLIGDYMKVENLNSEYNVCVKGKSLDGIRKWVSYEIKFKSSKLNVKASLDDNSSMLKFSVNVDWHEVGGLNEGVPQLSFYAPLSIKTEKYRYDIPFGTIDRVGKNHDMPANSYAAALPEQGRAVMVVTDTKYGFRTVDNSISVSLIRSSYDPDPYPEYGVHTINIGLAVTDDSCNKTFGEIRSELIHYLPFISGKKHAGRLPLDMQLFKLSGDVLISGIKTAEDSKDGKTVIIRLYDANGKGGKAGLIFSKGIKEAHIVDINEKKLKKLSVSQNTVEIEIPACQVITVSVRMDDLFFGGANYAVES